MEDRKKGGYFLIGKFQNPQFQNFKITIMDILRFITAGSVDDGKSTLIGRLLYDSKKYFDRST
jgi:hypothetical protein